MKKSPLRRASKQRAKQLAKYCKLKSQFFTLHRFCEFPTNGLPSCINHAEHVHHIKGRSGEMLNDKRYWMPICPYHHAWIHNNAKEARKRGLLK